MSFFMLGMNESGRHSRVDETLDEKIHDRKLHGVYLVNAIEVATLPNDTQSIFNVALQFHTCAYILQS